MISCQSLACCRDQADLADLLDLEVNMVPPEDLPDVLDLQDRVVMLVLQDLRDLVVP